MPGWEIANLADGSVDRMCYGGRTRLDRRDDVGHKLATQDQDSTAPLAVATEERLDDAGDDLATQDPTGAGPRMTFTLFPSSEQLPPGYRLVSIREVHDHREALRRAMPGWEFAALADGSVDGMHYGGRTRLDRRGDAGHMLGNQDPSATYAEMNMQDLRATYPWEHRMLPALLIVYSYFLLSSEGRDSRE